MNLRDITSQDMLDRIAELKAQKPEIETLGYMLGPDGMLEWAHSVGVSTDEKLRAIVPAVPPLELRSIVAAPSESVFLWSGLKDAQMCAAYIERFVQPKGQHKTRILDFGAGCGRTIRFLQAASQFETYASDVNEGLMDWCRRHLQATVSKVNGAMPPVPFEPQQFDFVYSLSVFTHLPEASMRAWLGELSRVTAHDGIVLLTTHGYPALDTICASEQHLQMFQMTRREVTELRDTFEKQRFHYRRYSANVIAVASAGDDYGNSFTHESYIREHWAGDGFEVVEFLPGGLRGFQDVTILRRRRRG